MAADAKAVVRTRCPAKVNLTFEILGSLPDGYHEVRTLMQAVSLEDELVFHFSPGSGRIAYRRCQSQFADAFPADDTNLISKAIRIYQQEVAEARHFDVEIDIKKNIPIGAGVAGGSANAAAALIAINQQSGRMMSQADLLLLGGTVGADVPFCIAGGTCIGAHKGDVITVIENSARFALVLAKPRLLSISTPWAFKQFDRVCKTGGAAASDTTRKCVDVLKDNRVDQLGDCLNNDLERPVFGEYSQLTEIRQALEECGAFPVRLTGSGPTIYGIVPTLEDGHVVKQRLEFVSFKNQSVSPLDIWVVETVAHGASIVDN